jgi:lysine 6-dehydrogenase
MGDGRIARACAWFLRKAPWTGSVVQVPADADLRAYELLIGALPGEIGGQCLAAALKYRKNLIDISDVDPPGYLKKLTQIHKAGITVIPGCGFSPGLVNFILGKEFKDLSPVQSVEVEAGSLSPKKRLYPFLWCFEDIVLEHRIPSQQIVGGQIKTFPAFAGYRKERHFGIAAESYYCASGFENLLAKASPRSFVVRVVRPEGFREFFGFMENQGLLKKKNFLETKKMLESEKNGNITFARVTVFGKKGKRVWVVKVRSGRDEELNSMQKITASVPAAMAKFLTEGMIGARGLLFMEDLARHEGLGTALISDVRKKGITVSHD